MKKKKKIEILKILKGIVITVLLVILALNIYIMLQEKTKPNSVPSVFGYKPFIVLSGSMESTIHVGDLIFVEEVDTNTLQVNDIISFRNTENLVTTHRIIRKTITNEGTCYITKGDNNNIEDEGKVCSNQIEGKYKSRMGKIGNIILFVQQPLGFAVMLLSIFIICIFIYIFSNRNTDKMTKEELKEFEEFKKAKQRKQEEK